MGSAETDPETIVTETKRLVEAQAGLYAVGRHLIAALLAIDSARAIAPDLAPELGEARKRVGEVTDHLLAAADVIAAKMEQIRESLWEEGRA